MRSFKVNLEYDGTDFCGFQFQVGQRSVQAEIEQAVLTLTGQAVRVNGAGRTDTGVHALGQVISFQAETRIPVEKLSAAMNSAMPRDVRAVGAAEVDELNTQPVDLNLNHTGDEQAAKNFHAQQENSANAFIVVAFDGDDNETVRLGRHGLGNDRISRS